MFDQKSPRWLRAVSLFHVPLLAVLAWGPWRLGYDPGVFPLALQLPAHLLLWVMFGT
jgi:hypothetical protein